MSLSSPCCCSTRENVNSGYRHPWGALHNTPPNKRCIHFYQDGFLSGLNTAVQRCIITETSIFAIFKGMACTFWWKTPQLLLNCVLTNHAIQVKWPSTRYSCLYSPAIKERLIDLCFCQTTTDIENSLFQDFFSSGGKSVRHIFLS